MAKYNHSKCNHNKKDRNTEVVKSGRPKLVTKRIVVTSQTAYHITELALRENITEGKLIDKIMRTYLATQQYQP